MSNRSDERDAVAAAAGPGLSRRAVLVAAGALAAASWPGSARAQPARKPRRIRKALKYGMIGPGATVAEKFRIARACGFDGVEMDSPSALDLHEVLRARDESGIVIPGVVDSVHWSKPLSHPDEAVRAEGRRALETALRDCHTLGGSTVLLVPAVVNGSMPYDAAYERSQKEVRAVLPLARELGVSIALENVWNGFLLSPLEAARYVDELNGDAQPDRAPSVGWYLDVGNVVNTGWPEQWVRILGHRILKLDIKEYSRKKRDAEGLWKGFDVEIGDPAGDCGWPEVMASLDEAGYSGGWATAEVGGGDEARLRDIAARMDRVLAM
jgi:hexulose-6-phosphate isomerase